MEKHVCKCPKGFRAAGINVKTTEECDTTVFMEKHVGFFCFALQLVKDRIFNLRHLVGPNSWRLKHDDVKLSKIMCELDEMETILATYADRFQAEASRQIDHSDSDSDSN